MYDILGKSPFTDSERKLTTRQTRQDADATVKNLRDAGYTDVRVQEVAVPASAPAKVDGKPQAKPVVQIPPGQLPPQDPPDKGVSEQNPHGFPAPQANEGAKDERPRVETKE